MDVVNHNMHTYFTHTWDISDAYHTGFLSVHNSMNILDCRFKNIVPAMVIYLHKRILLVI